MILLSLSRQSGKVSSWFEYKRVKTNIISYVLIFLLKFFSKLLIKVLVIKLLSLQIIVLWLPSSFLIRTIPNVQLAESNAVVYIFFSID